MKFFGLAFLPVAIACALLLLSGAGGPDKTPIAAAAQNGKGDRPAHTSNTQSEESQFPGVDSATSQSGETYAYRIENYYYNPATAWNWPEIVVAFSALGMVIFAASLMFLARRSAKATETAAAAVAESVLATRALVNLERPWIDISKKTLIGLSLEERPNLFPVRVEIAWELANVGRSPGLITSIFTAVLCAPVSNIPEPIYGDEPIPTGEMLVPPASAYANTSHKDLSEEEYGALMARNLCIIFYGRIQYHDTSRRELHVTRFCYRWYRENELLVLDSVTPRNYIEYT